jgi:RNA polymerase sigma-70 factor (ECF subfamily)
MEKVNFDPNSKKRLQQSFLRLSEKNTDDGPCLPSSEDKEWFIRKSFETDAKKGCELLFKCYYNSLCSHAARFVYSKQIAEDLVGEVFYVFWQKQLHTQIHTSYRSYLFTAVRHRALTYVRCELNRKNSSQDIGELNNLSSHPSPDQMLQYDELYFKIDKAIQSLTPQSQKVFIMSRFESKKNQVIADELKLSLKTVEAHLTKALSSLRKAVKGGWLILLCLLGNLPGW